MIRVTEDSAEIQGILSRSQSDFPVSALRYTALPYFASIQNSGFSDESFVILKNDLPICSAVRVKASGKIGFFDQPFRVEFSKGFFRGDSKVAFDSAFLHAVWGSEVDSSDLRLELPVAEEQTNGLLERLLPFANHHTHHVEGYIDVFATGDNPISHLRKSYRHEIRKTEPKLDEVRTFFGEIDSDVFDAFQALHLASAGKVTRPQESWDQQKFAIEDRRASLTTVSFESQIVGATFSWLAPSSGLYGTGAYDRTKFSQLSVSHVSLFRAIEHAREIGVRQYILGEIFSTGGTPKQRNISNFKRGFSTNRKHFHRLQLSRT